MQCQPPLTTARTAHCFLQDSSAGLAQMYDDLTPLANNLRRAAHALLFFSILFCGSLEGLFGLIAACGVLCCAAPGSLGVAYAARCTRITATICAVMALLHIICLATFSLAVLPQMPHAFHHVCTESMKMEQPPLEHQPHHEHPPHHGEGHPPMFGLLSAPSVETGRAEVVPSAPAHLVATVATSAARRLQEMAIVSEETSPACERAERVFAKAAPLMLFFAMVVELGLFMSALSTAKAAGKLLMAARRYGANAI